jgi:hypothetical protein
MHHSIWSIWISILSAPTLKYDTVILNVQLKLYLYNIAALAMILSAKSNLMN